MHKTLFITRKSAQNIVTINCCLHTCQASSMLSLVFSVLIFAAREESKSACCNSVATFGSSLFRKLPSCFTPEIMDMNPSLTQDIQIKLNVQKPGGAD
jgi:hypothetical protein